jgi:DNA-binding MarR family transcriptional regulator
MTPPAPPDEESMLRLIYAIGRFHTAMRTELAHRLAAEGLTVSEFTALSVLGARSGLSNAQLARRSLVSPQAMSQVLGALEDKGLVSRAPVGEERHPGHHRARAASLTAAGRRTARRAEQVIDGIEQAAFPELDGERRSELAALLRDGAGRLRPGR